MPQTRSDQRTCSSLFGLRSSRILTRPIHRCRGNGTRNEPQYLGIFASSKSVPSRFADEPWSGVLAFGLVVEYEFTRGESQRLSVSFLASTRLRAEPANSVRSRTPAGLSVRHAGPQRSLMSGPAEVGQCETSLSYLPANRARRIASGTSKLLGPFRLLNLLNPAQLLRLRGPSGRLTRTSDAIPSSSGLPIGAHGIVKVVSLPGEMRPCPDCRLFDRLSARLRLPFGPIGPSAQFEPHSN
ncbi:unnamed protein product [Protopolystoma xenopodis]|uniref:Uncharacterized protein n=1 Tax=Protopolystoma xenopodis TaxID=117903 RepID=A0A3S5ACR2_9PLAT|nr:unnamed protein product [Protopolystoma xenopodis]